MRTNGRTMFTTVRSEGALLPPDLLQRIVDNDQSLGGLTPDDYHLPGNERLGEAINRSWNALLGAWASFGGALERLAAGDAGTTITRERWLLPLFQELNYGRLQTAKALELDGRTYPVSHVWQSTPIHLVGLNVDLDKRTTGVAGAARMSPHGLVQELLNRSKEHLWGIASNGLHLRVLRDNVSLTRQAYVEFDLEAMMRDEVYADFALLWLLCHQSRFESEDGRHPWLERWVETAKTEGTRALDTLRNGVQSAIEALGQGFLSHPANAGLRERLYSGQLPREDYYRQLLRLVYRLIFLFVAEDRRLLLLPDAPDEARQRYERYYSVSRVRRLSERRRGTKHPDLFEGLKMVMVRLGTDEGCPELGLPALGSFLWSPAATHDLNDCQLPNADLLGAVRALAFVEDKKQRVRRVVDYRNIGSEELGSIYESLLEMHPEDLNREAATFRLGVVTGNERKTTGSYYTPTSLINALLDSALESVLAEAMKKPDPEAAILDLKVLDPASGSGHFLVAAAHRLAKRLAFVRTGDEEPSPEATRTALRDVISRCVYGIDVNAMAVELCKVSLWMEAMEPGKPLSFLDHHIVCGNSLLGVTPRLLSEGIPEEAFASLEGDDKKVVSELKRRNNQERKGQHVLALGPSVADLARPLADGVSAIEHISPDTVAALHEQEQLWAKLEASDAAAHAKLVADAWCAAFVMPKRKGAPVLTEGVLQLLMKDPRGGDPAVRKGIREVAERHKFLHPHLAFPNVFGVPEEDEGSETSWVGGFDVVVGNPPWERVKLSEKEWFASRQAEIAETKNATARKKLIEGLATEDPDLYQMWLSALRGAECESHYIRRSGRYPLCGRGDVNTYAVFAELMRSLCGPRGRAGAIVPSGIATDDTTKDFFTDLVDHKALVSLFDFENRENIFPAVYYRVRFSLLTMAGTSNQVESANFTFFAHSVQALSEPDRLIALTAGDFELLNPNTRTCPVFRSRRDAEIAKRIYSHVPIFVLKTRQESSNPWGASFLRMFDMSNDSALFRTHGELADRGWALDGNVFRRDGRKWLPLYEAKMVSYFNHRYADYALHSLSAGKAVRELPHPSLEQLADPHYAALPHYWVRREDIDARLSQEREWLLGFRDITNTTNERTVVAAFLPRAGVANNMPLINTVQSGELTAFLGACLSSFAVDYLARLKVGGTHLNFFIAEQLPIPPPGTYKSSAPWDSQVAVGEWLKYRILELVFTAWDMDALAADLGYEGPPFRWDDTRRPMLRAELDAAFFQLYGYERPDVEHAMDSFWVVHDRDIHRHSEYRTKRLILERYDAMSKAIDTGDPYQTVVDPPPADPSVTHPDSVSSH
jgi:N-6 DNA Methylase